MKQTNTRAMVETAFVSTIVVMLTIVGSTVPFLSLLATLVAPSGIALIGIRWGSKYSCAASVVAFVLVSLLVGPLMAMATILAYSLPSIFLGEAFRANWSFGKLIVIPAIALKMCIRDSRYNALVHHMTHIDLIKKVPAYSEFVDTSLLP